MDLKTTPAHPKANSYISLTDAELYFSAYDRIASSDSWYDLSDDKKKLGLYLAAKIMNNLPYKGKPVTKIQSLAFPRFTWRQINQENRFQYKSFIHAVQETRQIIDSGEIEALNNRLYDRSSSANGFFQPYLNENIDIGQVIKVVGLSSDTYLTISDVDVEGEYIEIQETISDEDAPSGGVDIYTTPLFGNPDQAGKAQAELALQVVNLDLFEKEFGELPDALPQSFDLDGALSMNFSYKVSGQSKFSSDKNSPIDIVYYYLNDWIGVKGGIA